MVFKYANKCCHCAKNTIHQVATMVTTSKNVLFPSHNHMLATGIDGTTLIISRTPASERSSAVLITWKYDISNMSLDHTDGRVPIPESMFE